MTCEPHWTSYFSALLIPTIAVLGAFIAYRQWRLGQNKLKLDLFDRRFSVYDAARNFLAGIMTSGKAKDEDIYKFVGATREAKWLLNSEIAAYLHEVIYKKALALASLQAELEGIGVGTNRSKNVTDQRVIKEWFMAQYEVLDEHFSKFLKLDH